MFYLTKTDNVEVLLDMGAAVDDRDHVRWQGKG